MNKMRMLVVVLATAGAGYAGARFALPTVEQWWQKRNATRVTAPAPVPSELLQRCWQRHRELRLLIYDVQQERKHREIEQRLTVRAGANAAEQVQHLAAESEQLVVREQALQRELDAIVRIAEGLAAMLAREGGEALVPPAWLHEARVLLKCAELAQPIATR